MREISTERIKLGEHILIDGVEYVAEEGGGCEGCPITEGGSVLCGFCPFGGHIVKVKKEPKYRPYEDTAEMIADFKERFKPKDWPSYSMPLIWVMKNGAKAFITGFGKEAIHLHIKDYFVSDLLGEFTYLDGTPCGKEVNE